MAVGKDADFQFYATFLDNLDIEGPRQTRSSTKRKSPESSNGDVEAKAQADENSLHGSSSEDDEPVPFAPRKKALTSEPSPRSQSSMRSLCDSSTGGSSTGDSPPREDEQSISSSEVKKFLDLESIEVDPFKQKKQKQPDNEYDENDSFFRSDNSVPTVFGSSDESETESEAESVSEKEKFSSHGTEQDGDGFAVERVPSVLGPTFALYDAINQPDMLERSLQEGERRSEVEREEQAASKRLKSRQEMQSNFGGDSYTAISNQSMDRSTHVHVHIAGGVNVGDGSTVNLTLGLPPNASAVPSTSQQLTNVQQTQGDRLRHVKNPPVRKNCQWDHIMKVKEAEAAEAARVLAQRRLEEQLRLEAERRQEEQLRLEAERRRLEAERLLNQQRRLLLLPNQLRPQAEVDRMLEIFRSQTTRSVTRENWIDSYQRAYAARSAGNQLTGGYGSADLTTSDWAKNEKSAVKGGRRHWVQVELLSWLS